MIYLIGVFKENILVRNVVMNFREELKNKKRIVIKVGSSSLVHQSTGELDLVKVERLIRVLSDLKNQGKDVVLVSSGAVTVGCKRFFL